MWNLSRFTFVAELPPPPSRQSASVQFGITSGSAKIHEAHIVCPADPPPPDDASDSLATHVARMRKGTYSERSMCWWMFGRASSITAGVRFTPTGRFRFWRGGASGPARAKTWSKMVPEGECAS